MIYTPSYIFSLIFFALLLIISVIIIYNLLYHLFAYINANEKYSAINHDDYPESEQLDFLKNTNSYNTAVKIALNKKNEEVFKRNENNTLKDLLAFKFEHDSKRINNQLNQIDLTDINDSETKALNTFKNKININSINPEFDDYNNDLAKENNKGLSVVTNLMNPNYYLVNPLNKVNNQDVMNIQMSEDVNLNKIISNKIDAIITKKLDLQSTQDALDKITELQSSRI